MPDNEELGEFRQLLDAWQRNLRLHGSPVVGRHGAGKRFESQHIDARDGRQISGAGDFNT